MTPADLDRWRALAEAAVEPNPFFEPAFVTGAAQHLPDAGASLLVVEDAGRWLACLPVPRGAVGRVVPVLRTWRHPYCFLGTPLLDAEPPRSGGRRPPGREAACAPRLGASASTC